MRNPKVPPGTETIRTYREYGKLVDGFFNGFYQLLFIVGRPGLAKSYEFKERLGERGHLIKGWAAPLQAYIEAYRHRHQPLIFDDAEVLWKRPGGRILIRSLTEHRPQKLVQWKSTTKELKKAGVPQSFRTTSKIAIIANRFSFGSEEERVDPKKNVRRFSTVGIWCSSILSLWRFTSELGIGFGARRFMITSASGCICSTILRPGLTSRPGSESRRAGTGRS